MEKNLIPVIVDLKLDWVSHKAAKYACEHWHYSKTIPVGKLVKIGVWEDNKYIGAVLFGRGANNNLGKAFNLKQDEVCELVRVALKAHKTQVSKIIAIAIKLLKKTNPGLKLIVSYADSGQNHHGGIYQAGNWIYDMSSNAMSTVINGKKYHNKSVYSKYGYNGLKKLIDNGINASHVKDDPKHRYLMPLNKEMREKIKKTAKPYPKRVKQAIASHQDDSGRASLTNTLQTNCGV